MKLSKLLMGLFLLSLLVGGVSAITWTAASGCWTATDGTDTLYMWNATGTSYYTIPTAGNVWYLVVGGGGYSGGGGGGVLNGTSTFPTDVTVIVGDGAHSYASPYQGGYSSFGSINATGGGNGGGSNEDGLPGGSGGGAGVSGGAHTGGAGISGQGFAGSANYATASPYPSGAGGGAGAAASAATATVGGNGGNGNQSAINGTLTYYGGGGSGSSGVDGATGSPGTPGLGGGGTGADVDLAPATNGVDGLGGGGGKIYIGGGEGGSGVVIIRFATQAPVSSFTANVTEGTDLLAVAFTDTSTNTPTSWIWKQSNLTHGGETFSILQNPTYVFPAGNHTINLTATNAAGSGVSTQVTWVNVSGGNSLAANFAKNSTGGQVPLAVAFTDTSTTTLATIDNWYWIFGDQGVGNTSTLQNPTHTYTTNGTHTINLTITNTSYGLVSTKLSNIVVNNTVLADFVGAPLSGYATTDVFFVDFSINEGIYAWDWDFGDGGTSTERNPTHPYTTVGAYNVSLTVTSVDGINTKTETDYITITGVSDINPLSTYRFKPDANIIRNSTLYNRTIQMGNVTNATYAIGSTTFDAANIQVTRVLANKSTYSDISLVSSTINNATGVATFNVTRTGGFAPGATFVSIVDVEMLYYNYHSGTTGAAWGSGSLINGTYRNTFPVTYLSDAPLTYDWVTHSDFTISDDTPTSGVTVVTLTPSDRPESANRFLWNFGDGTTFLDYNGTAVTHIYTGVGPTITPFSTSLTAYLSANTSVTNTTTKTITPVYAADWVKANFTAIPVNGGVGLAVIFTDLSEFGTPGGQTYNWSFGDDFLSANPYSNTVGSTSHVYTALGTYTVKLTVNNTLNTDNETKLSYITVSNQQSTTFYSPKTTAFHVVDQYGNQIKGATVTANFNQSNLPPTATTWLVSNYGMNINAANEALDGALMMTGLTSDTGDITFVMIAALEYDLTVTYNGSSSRFMISPQNNFYQLKFLTAAVADNSIGTCVYANGNTHSGIARPDIGNITFMFSYQDTCGTTVAIDYYVLDNDLGTTLYHYQLTPVTTGIYVNNYTVSNVRGKSYSWWQNSTRDI